VVAYWRGTNLVLERYAPPPTLVSAAPVTIRILAWFTKWRTAESLFRQLPQHSKGSLQEVLDALVDHRILERRNHSPASINDAMAQWDK
jgi:hypothetical protein